VALFDETSFAKIEVSGAGALLLLQQLCDNDVDRPVGAVVYTQMLNPRGGIECDFTVTRLAADRFAIVTGTAFGNHDLAWIRRHQPEDGGVEVRDVTSSAVCLGVWGPRARDVLQPLSSQDLSNAAFPYMTARWLSVGEVPLLALRVTYVGELGWELYAPTEYGRRLWDLVWDSGQEHGMVAGGYRAIDSLRLEKGYRVWSSDITPADTPDEAGLGFAVRIKKPVDFIGKPALVAARTAGITRRLVPLLLDDPQSVALGGEPVSVDGRVVGRVTSGGYGYTLERSIAYAYLPADHLAAGTSVNVEVFGQSVAATVAAEPLFDPSGSRIRA
jgi:4-methylaminobutanoate oxidase (formaldehyde-forming)